jgi:hypothetical protein
VRAPRPRPVQEALDFIGEAGRAWGDAGPDAAADPARDAATDAAFDRVARTVFAFQFENNPPYRRFCLRRGAAPESTRSWDAIPPVPTAAFGAADLVAGPWSHRFTTSGTSRGTEGRGRHLLPELALYEASWQEPFRRHLLPDRDRIRILSLIPPPDVLPHSSLSFMAGRVMERFGEAGSGWFLGASGLDRDGLGAAAAQAVAEDEPVLLLGTALGFLEWKTALESAGPAAVPGGLPAEEGFPAEGAFSGGLPAGSRIMDTGGLKGRARTADRGDLMAFYTRRLGIAEDHVVGEYGMTELCSQFYEPVLAEAVGAAAPLRRAAFASGEPRERPTGFDRVFAAPPWTRTRVLDPETLKPLPDGEAGLLAHWDLANAWSVLAVVTEDLGIRAGERFRLLGRARDAELRGCSLATEELLGG